MSRENVYRNRCEIQTGSTIGLENYLYYLRYAKLRVTSVLRVLRIYHAHSKSSSCHVNNYLAFNNLTPLSTSLEAAIRSLNRNCGIYCCRGESIC